MSIFDEVRERCRAVADGAEHVRIDLDRLAAYAAELDLDPDVGLDPAHHRLGSVEETVAFVLSLDAVNFGSGWFPFLRKPDGRSGYFTVATALRERFEADGAPSAHQLVDVDADFCAELFGQRGAPTAAQELMAHFAEALRQLGQLLLDRYDASSVALVESAGRSAGALVERLRAMPYYEDRRQWRGLDIPFYKRAQITAADLATAFDGKGPGRFGDLDELTIFADNLVPHVLRVDGVLHLDPGLEATIGAGVLVPEGSSEEVELRACAVDAVERLADALGRRVPAARLDTLLWNRGQEPRYKAVPRHRTRTVSY